MAKRDRKEAEAELKGIGAEADEEMDDKSFWQWYAARCKEKFNSDRARFLEDAQAKDDGGWVKHTQWHWSRTLCGNRLDYWPSRKKWMYLNEVKRGDVHAFMERIKREQQQWREKRVQPTLAQPDDQSQDPPWD